MCYIDTIHRRVTQKGIIMENNSITNSLKRLERAGDESSKTTAKLKLACEEVAKEIIDIIKESGIIDDIDYEDFHAAYTLPAYNLDTGKFTRDEKEIKAAKAIHRVWLVQRFVPGVGCRWHLSYVANEYYNCFLDASPSRGDALSFSYIIAKGLLDAVREWIESENQKSTKAIERYEVEK
jgi:hypothetical protein